VVVDLIQRGITGFWHVDDPEPIETITEREQRKTVDTIVAALGGDRWSVEQVDSKHPCETFRRFSFMLTGERFICLTHSHVRVAAIVPHGWTILEPEFPDLPCNLDHVAEIAPWHVATGAALREPLPVDLADNLPPCELNEVRYWKPEALGELVFNAWD